MPQHGFDLGQVANISLVDGAVVSNAAGQNIIADGTLGESVIGSTQVTDESLTNADVSSTAGIALSKLEAVTVAQIPVGSEGGTLVARSVTGDVHISDQGVTAIQGGAVKAFHVGTEFPFSGVEADVTPVLNVTPQTTTTKVKKLYAGTITGTPVVGATLLQATSGATGTVAEGEPGPTPWFILSLSSDNFDTTNVVTGTNPDLSTFTFTPALAQVDLWTLSPAASFVLYAMANDGTRLNQLAPVASGTGPTPWLTANAFSQSASTKVETLTSDGWTSLYVGGVSPSQVLYTPSGTITPTDPLR